MTAESRVIAPRCPTCWNYMKRMPKKLLGKRMWRCPICGMVTDNRPHKLRAVTKEGE